jgi:hypothetical protein
MQAWQTRQAILALFCRFGLTFLQFATLLPIWQIDEEKSSDSMFSITLEKENTSIAAAKTSS